MDVMVIKEGTIVTPYSMYQADVKVVDGVITAIAKDIEPEGTVIDAKGKLVLPGAVDVHTHLDRGENCHLITQMIIMMARWRQHLAARQRCSII